MFITAAVYEDMMQTYEESLKNGCPLQAEKAVSDTMDVLRQFGYDSGAAIFQNIMYLAVRENMIRGFDV
ncbi:MAG: hypothetical protein J5537_01710 [Lachnospiraceae bacterium]|nr:hypothetical protein [Lachnospiraceae bacterium]